MIPFEHTGPERPVIRGIRNLLLGILFLAGIVLLFPFVLLVLFLRGLWFLSRPRSA
jgi:hypothetical protein